MHLNHLNLVVSNVRESVTLFETYFNFRCVETKGGDIVAILKGEDDFSLVIMKSKGGKAIYPDAFHLGFMLDCEEAVTSTYLSLKDGGIEIERAPTKIRDSWGFYFRFDSLMIEVGIV